MRFYLKKKYLFLILTAILCHAANGYSQDQEGSCDGGTCTCGSEDIAPAGIMNNHVHEKGKWMLSYQYMHDNMSGNILGSSAIANSDIYNNYLMAPDRMTMDMHMLMLMYGLTDRLTIMAMGSYNNSWMNMNMYGNAPMNMPGMKEQAVMPNTQTVSGLGDTKLYAVYSIVKNSRISLVGSAGLSLPTGSVQHIAFPQMFSNLHADYNMQTGSGTLDFLPGLSLMIYEDFADFGATINGTLRPFFNVDGYRLGQEGNANIWAAKKWNSWLSTSVRVEGRAAGNISGSDANLIAVMEPTANAATYGGFKAFAYPGINLYPGTLFSTEYKIRLEYGLPFYQYAQGVQMRNTSCILANLDLSF